MQTTAQLTDNTLEKIQELIVAHVEGVKTFEEAAESIDQPSVANLFKSLADARSDFAKQLQQHAVYNRDEDFSGAKGVAHRSWVKLRSAVSGGDTRAVLNEAGRSEDILEAKYKEVLQETAGTSLHGMIREQYSKFLAGQDRLRELRSSYYMAN